MNQFYSPTSTNGLSDNPKREICLSEQELEIIIQALQILRQKIGLKL